VTAERLALGPDARGKVMIAEGDRIVFFGIPEDDPSGVQVRVACDQASIEPGRINAHTHIYSGLAPLNMPPPEPDPENFVQILERVWWKLDRALDEASLRAAARLYVAEALRAGTSMLIDHHESPEFIEGSLEVLADTCQELGMRAVLCFGATERNGGREEALRGLEECRRFITSNDRPLVQGVVALHASFTVSDETIRDAARLCKELDTVLHVHMAEDAADVDDARNRGHTGPLERLLELDALPAGSILAHGVHLSAEEVQEVEKRGIWLVQNPRSNRGNRVGYPHALGESRKVALGTDGYPSWMEDEATVLLEEAASHGERLEAVGRRIMSAHSLAMERFGKSFAPLDVGGAADAVAVGEAGVQSLVVGGRPVVVDGLLITGDLEEIRAHAREQAPRLWDRMAALT